MASFQSAVDFGLPIIILIVGLWILYRPLQEPLQPLWALFGRMWEKMTGQEDNFFERGSIDYE